MNLSIFIKGPQSCPLKFFTLASKTLIAPCYETIYIPFICSFKGGNYYEGEKKKKNALFKDDQRCQVNEWGSDHQFNLLQRVITLNLR